MNLKKRGALLLVLPLACQLQAQTLTVLTTFTGANGATPAPAPLTLGRDGNLYGTTWLGGKNLGTIYQITPAGTLTTIHTFAQGEGITREGALLQASDGSFYGTNVQGGAHNQGTIFNVTPDGTFATIYNFGSASTDGTYPNGALTQGTDGNLYGVTQNGGAHSLGTIFRVTPGGTFTTLHSFAGAPADGGTPKGGLIQATDGNFYGTCSEGGKGGGIVFRMTPAGVVTIFDIFAGTTGESGSPYAGVVQAADGNLYGTAGAHVFKMSLAGTFAVISSWATDPNFADGGEYSGLIQATDGNLYGISPTGGVNQGGYIFRVALSGAASVVYSFTNVTGGSAPNPNGATPQGGVTQAPDGNLYGVALGGVGASQTTLGAGVVYRLTLPAATPPAPTITSGGIVPLDGTTSTVQPGEWVSIFGTNLAASAVSWNGDFPQSLGGTSVTIAATPAYISYVSPGQINLQVPGLPSTGPVQVVVATPGGSASSMVTIAPQAPSFFLLDAKHVAGIISRPDGTYDTIGPTGNSLGFPTVAATAGDTVELYALGLGPTNPAVPSGQVFSGAAPTTNPVTVLINSVPVVPLFAGLSGAGVYQLNLVIPAGLGTGDVPVQAMVSGVQTQTGAVISLQ